MKTKQKKNTLALIFGIILILCISVVGVLICRNTDLSASADTNTDSGENVNVPQFDVIDYQGNKVYATYQFVKLNETDCSVRITNKALATTANIPSEGIIDGKKYVVTEIASNGFMSSTKLKVVKLSHSIKKICNMAFANCSQLQYANFRKSADITMSIVVTDKIVGQSGLTVSKRTSDLKLTIHNINIKAVSGNHAIVMDSAYSLLLYSYNSSITGSDTLTPKNDTLTTKQSSSAIYCKYLVLYTSVTLRGGSNISISPLPYIGGVAVSLIEGGYIILQSDNISIIGGNCQSPTGYAGYAVYAKNKNYSIKNLNSYANVVISRGSTGSQTTHTPYIGY